MYAELHNGLFRRIVGAVCFNRVENRGQLVAEED